MPSLKDLLEYLAMPGLEDIWVLLDIKVPWPSLLEPFQKCRIDHWEKLDTNADDVMRLIATTLEEVKPSRAWNERVLLGCWAVGILITFLMLLSNNLIGQLPSLMYQVSAWVPYNSHRFQYFIRPSVSESSWSVFQYASEGDGRTNW